MDPNVSESGAPIRRDPETRVVSEIPAPCARLLGIGDVFNSSGRPRIDILRKHFVNEGRLTADAANLIIQNATANLKSEKTLLHLDSPISVVGDVHGQFYDLVKIFKLFGDVPDTRYLFLGDYVDRGMFGIETVLLLLALKANYPKSIYLLRGNHESRNMTAYFTFKKECQVKYNSEVYENCMKAFDSLPLVAVVDRAVFCVHGGLSPLMKKVNEILIVDRFKEPTSGIMMHLLWSDPADDYGEESKDQALFYANRERGCAYCFTYAAVVRFLRANNLQCVIRAHQAQEFGFNVGKNDDKTGFPTLITVFSAPNYCDTYGNKGAVIHLSRNNFTISQFDDSPHPYCLPGFANAFEWSLPFVGESVTRILLALLNVCSEEELEQELESGDRRKEAIKNKVRAVGKMARMFQDMRQERLAVLHLKGLTASGKLGNMGGESANKIVEAVNSPENKENKSFNVSFEEAKVLDASNERIPVMALKRGDFTDEDEGAHRQFFEEGAECLEEGNECLEEGNECLEEGDECPEEGAECHEKGSEGEEEGRVECHKKENKSGKSNSEMETPVVGYKLRIQRPGILVTSGIEKAEKGVKE